LTGVAGLVAFGVWGASCPVAQYTTAVLTLSSAEWKGNKEGLLHHALFSKSRNYGISLALLFLEGILFFSFNAFWSREASLILGLPAWVSYDSYCLVYAN
jgi:hypothetical protein